MEFFSRFRCKLYFIDLFDDLPALTACEDDTPSPLQLFSESLQFPSSTRFDLCLFWDFMCYLDDPALTQGVAGIPSMTVAQFSPSYHLDDPTLTDSINTAISFISSLLAVQQ